MKKVLFCICLSLISQHLISQQFSENFVHSVDSLKAALSTSQNKTTTLEILRQIALKFAYVDMDSVIYHGQRFISTAEQYNDKVRLLDAMGTTGEAYIQKGDLPNALELSLQAIKIYEDNPGLIISTDSTPGIGPANYNLSEIYFHIGDDEKAHEYTNKLITMLTDKTGIGYGHYLKGRIFERNNQLDSAMRHINLSLKIFDDVSQTYRIYSDKYDINPDGHNLLAKIYLKQGEPAKALAELQNILRINILKGETFRTAQTYNDLAHFYSTQGILDSSIYYAGKALRESDKIKFPRGKLDAYSLLAKMFESTDPIKALEYYKLAISIQNSLYGAGNVQVLKEMIAQKEKEKEKLALAQSNYKNKLKQYLLSGGLLVFLLIATIFFRNNKKSKAANLVLAKTLKDLKSTQAQLIQSEKMASLGELTAGIAHEIQNPLNFVNNFSELNKELVTELNDELAIGNEQLAKGNKQDVLIKIKSAIDIAKDLKDNSEKINQHGQRASSIVKGMLEHSRKSSGEKSLTDINAMCDEYLRLSYHGLRAKDQNFQCDFKLDLDPNIPKINVVSQDISRVLLNIINNAFQSVNEKQQKPLHKSAALKNQSTSDQEFGSPNSTQGELGVRGDDSDERQAYQTPSEGNYEKYSPLVTISTKSLGDKIEISISDNGPGIPDSIKDKIFQPFFTTKPTGQGTGLGLSLAYDIIKAHGGSLSVKSNYYEPGSIDVKSNYSSPSGPPGGTLDVESKENKGSVFIICLPI